jgi:hypothetical protein
VHTVRIEKAFGVDVDDAHSLSFSLSLCPHRFDPLHLGYYCDACFVARHPPLRMTHAWSLLEGTAFVSSAVGLESLKSSIADDVNPDQSWMAHLVQYVSDLARMASTEVAWTHLRL